MKVVSCKNCGLSFLVDSEIPSPFIINLGTLKTLSCNHQNAKKNINNMGYVKQGICGDYKRKWWKFWV